MILMKRGVVLASLGPEDANAVLWYAQVADKIWYEEGWGDVVITAGIEGWHLHVDFHYRGHALDLRYPGWPGNDPEKRQKAIDRLRAALPDCDIVAEKDHIHIEPQGPVQ